MSFDPLSEKTTFKGATRDGWTFVASLTKRGRYVVAVQLFSPEGRLHGTPKSWLAGSFATLEEAQDGAQRYAHQLTPVDVRSSSTDSSVSVSWPRALLHAPVDAHYV